MRSAWLLVLLVLLGPLSGCLGAPAPDGSEASGPRCTQRYGTGTPLIGIGQTAILTCLNQGLTPHSRCKRPPSKWTPQTSGKQGLLPPMSTCLTGCHPTQKWASRSPSLRLLALISPSDNQAMSPVPRTLWALGVENSSTTTTFLMGMPLPKSPCLAPRNPRVALIIAEKEKVGAFTKQSSGLATKNGRMEGWSVR